MHAIQILGIDGSAETKKMQDNLKEALDSLGISTTVKEITKVEDLVGYKINGIPSLVVNGTVVLQKKVPDVEELKVLLKVFINPTSNQFHMKRIIVPTDFSPASENAFRYSLGLAAKHGGAIKTVHVFSPEFDPQNPYLGEPLKVLEETAAAQMKDFIDQTKRSVPADQLPAIETETVIGFPAEEIVRLACDGKTDLVVMGATGEKGLFEKVFGSISVAVAKKSDCPVLLVPEKTQYRDFKQILYASDFNNLSEPTLKRLLNISSIFNAGIHFVHVETGEEKGDFKEIENKLFKILFKDGEPTFSFTMSKIKGNSVAEGLNQYATANNIDMIVLMHPHRNFWDALFHRSVTTEVVFNPELPVLVLHGD